MKNNNFNLEMEKELFIRTEMNREMMDASLINVSNGIPVGEVAKVYKYTK